MTAFISLAVLIVVLVVAVVLAERSLRRQRGSMLRRTPEEDHAVGRVLVGLAHWRGSGG